MVAINNTMGALLNLDPSTMTEEQKQAYSNLMGTLVSGVTSAVGGDAAATQLATKVEEDNNYLGRLLAQGYQNRMVSECGSLPSGFVRDSCVGKIKQEAVATSNRLNQEMAAACKKDPTSTACSTARESANWFVRESEFAQQNGMGAATQIALNRVNGIVEQHNVVYRPVEWKNSQDAPNNAVLKDGSWHPAKVAAAAVTAGITSGNVYLQKCDTGGQNCSYTPVAPTAVQANSSGVVNIYNNGIFNNLQQALENAAKQSGNKANQEGIYVIVNPPTGNVVSEMLYVGYDKLNLMTGSHLPITNASVVNQTINNEVKAQGVEINDVDHSSGTITRTNALQDQYNNGVRNLPLGNSTYNGGAANAFSASHLNNNISGGQGVLQQSCHPYDPVCRVIGANPASQNNGSATIWQGLQMDTHGSYSGYLPPINSSEDIRNNDLPSFQRTV